MTPSETDANRRYCWTNQKGVAALVLIMLALVLMAVIVLSFVSQSENKQYGGSLLSTSVNAFLAAEAGIRHAEKCLQQIDANCPAITLNTDWTNLTAGYTMNFSDGNGSFTITFTIIDSTNVTINSVGTYRDSSREVSKTVSQMCKMVFFAATSCTTTQVAGGVTLTGTVKNGYCPGDLVDNVAFPPGGGGCPNATYPQCTNCVPAAPYQYCRFRLTGGTTRTLNGPLTLWVRDRFQMRNNSTLIINGDVTINVWRQPRLEDSAQIEVNGTLTFYSRANMVVRDTFEFNTTGGDPADVIILGQGNVQFQDDSIFNGGVVSDGTPQVRHDSNFTGALISSTDRVRLRNNSIVTHDPTAGLNALGYPECIP